MKYRIIDNGETYKIQIRKGFISFHWEDLLEEVDTKKTNFPDWMQGKVFNTIESDDLGYIMDIIMDLESKGDQ